MNAPLAWQIATVTEIRQETPDVKSFTFALPGWMPHLAGQHYDLRLTAADGYQAQRSYSIASEPMRTGVVELTVERIPDGEVSSYLHDVVMPGDRLELRGPIGGYFVWEAALGGPLLLIAGGSGVVPLHGDAPPPGGRRVPRADDAPAQLQEPRGGDLLRRARGPDRGRSHPAGLPDVDPGAAAGLDRVQPPHRPGDARRGAADGRPKARVFICGPTLLVEAASEILVGLGLEPSQIRTERFGPTGA